MDANTIHPHAASVDLPVFYNRFTCETVRDYGHAAAINAGTECKLKNQKARTRYGLAYWAQGEADEFGIGSLDAPELIPAETYKPGCSAALVRRA
jgi:hypothetical protein